MTCALIATPTGALPCPPRFPTPKAACSVAWVRAGGWGGAALAWAQPAAHCLLSLHAVRNPHTGSTFLLAALPASLLLLQWYEPLQKFLLLKVRGRGWSEVGGSQGLCVCGRGRGGEKWRPEHPCCPQNFSSPLPSPAGMLEPLVLDGKELPQVCVGAEGPEGPGCRVLFHVLPLEAGLTPDILIPPGEQETRLLGVSGCGCGCGCVISVHVEGVSPLS